VSGEKFTVNSEQTWDSFISHARKLYDEHHYVTFSYSTGRQRTGQQNKALHVYCQLLSDALNTAGLDQRHVLKEEIEIPWTMEAVKTHLWKVIQQAVIGKESTAEAERGDYTKVHEVLTRHLGDKLGLDYIPWPEKDRDNG